MGAYFYRIKSKAALIGLVTPPSKYSIKSLWLLLISHQPDSNGANVTVVFSIRNIQKLLAKNENIGGFRCIVEGLTRDFILRPL